jgi:hypothetical protein
VIKKPQKTRRLKPATGLSRQEDKQTEARDGRRNKYRMEEIKSNR